MTANSISIGIAGASSALLRHLRQRQTLALLGVGVLAVIVHASVRWPMHLPGHHGLEWMALLVLARQASGRRWAASVAAAGAAVACLVPVLGVHDPLAPLVYLIPGLVLDLFWSIAPLAWRRSALAIGVVAALGFAAKPLAHWAGAAALGLHYGSLSQGLGYLVLLHVLFAFAGASVAVAASRRILR